MKSIFISVLLLFVTDSFAQEAGKAGEFLKNEASKTEIGSLNKKRSDTKDNNNSGLRHQGNSGFRIKNPHESGYLLYRTTLNVRNNSRLVLDFFTDKGLYLLDSYPVQNQSYGFSSWNDVWNNPYGSQGGSWNNSGNNANVMDSSFFSEFLDMLRKNAKFDDSRFSMIRQQMQTTMFTAQQISILVKEMSFDKNRLSLAKSMYAKCPDKQKYFLVYDAFDFESSKRELMDFISKL